MIRAILFDLGKVIVPFDFDIAYRAIETRVGIDSQAIRERIRHTGLVARFETGQLEPEDFVGPLCEALGLNVDHEEFCEIWSSIFSRKPLLSEDFIAALAERYPLVLVSNTNHIHFEMIRQSFPLLQHFKALVLSYKIGAMKPDVAIYRAAVEAAGCTPAECFFTDDILEYVEAARRFGIDAVQFHDAEQLTRELHARNVKC